MEDNFYAQLEQSFRGERSEIKERLRFYMPFVQSMRKVHPAPRVLDLGCGRGEWLELLRDLNVQALGVDLSAAMLSDCKRLNLDVEQQDVISKLNSLEGESVSIVSAFHLVEHLPFEVLSVMISEAYRVLQPGGLLIMETPNPDNIQVGTANFWLDPTHTRPIPSGLLKLLAQHCGFCNVAVFGLQESSELRDNRSASLKDVFLGASPDYAVIAQKAANESILACFNDAFDRFNGLTTETLIDRYDQRINSEFSELTQAIAALNSQISAIHASTSWKVTYPLRLLSRVLRYIKSKLTGPN